jgi:beta-glucosidase
MASEEGAGSEMISAMLRYMPLRGLVGFSGGALSDEDLDEMLKQLNR